MALPNGLYIKRITCPVCKQESDTVKVKSQAVKLLKRDADFCGYYAGVNPVFYGVTQCIHCGYAAFESDFDVVRPAERDALLEKVASKWTPRAFNEARSLEDAIALHQMCLLCYSAMQRKPSELAKVCLRLAWFQRMLGNSDKEKHYLTFAMQQYTLAFERESLEADPEEQMLIYYLIGELKRQLADYQGALYWYQETLKLEHTKTRKPIETLVRDQIALARTAYAAQKK